MLPEYPQFKHISIKDSEIIEQALVLRPRSICELNLANLMVWQDFDRPQFTIINDNLCILVNNLNEKPYFLEPLGNNKLEETVNICLKHVDKLSRVSESFISLIPQHKYNIKCLRSQGDYIYETETLANLKGKKYDGKRNHIKRFIRKFPEYNYVKMDAGLQEQALDLFEQWFEAKEKVKSFHKLSYLSQRKALEMAFSHFKKLDLDGGALMTNEGMKGFMISSPLSNNMTSIHFSYTDVTVQGSSQILLWEGCNKTFNKYKYINLEQDVGISGLRKSKLSYHPLKLERKFEITAKN